VFILCEKNTDPFNWMSSGFFCKEHSHNLELQNMFRNAIVVTIILVPQKRVDSLTHNLNVFSLQAIERHHTETMVNQNLIANTIPCHIYMLFSSNFLFSFSIQVNDFI
jgi:hypothetical protein